MRDQLKYLQIDYVSSPTQAQGIPWAVISIEPENPDGTILIREIEGCGSHITTQDREYLDALLDDWKMVLNKDGDQLLDSLSGLAIGPLRASTRGQCGKEELEVQVRALNEKTRTDPPRIA